MESDKRYFLEGLFIVVLAAAIAFAFVWLSRSGHRDDVLYRVHFDESIAGLAAGEPVKYHGVEVGVVKSMSLDSEDSRRVVVNLLLRRGTPVKSDTRAMLKLKGITGVLFVELTGGSPDAPLLAAGSATEVPEIVSQKSDLASIVERLPKILDQFGNIGSKTQTLLSDVGVAAKNARVASENVKETSAEIRADPSSLIWKKKKDEPKKDDAKKDAAK